MATIIGMMAFYAFMAQLFNVAGITSSIFSGYFAQRLNTLASWLLFAAALILEAIALYWFRLNVTWLALLIPLNLIILIQNIIASAQACQSGSCCSSGKHHGGKGGKCNKCGREKHGDKCDRCDNNSSCCKSFFCCCCEDSDCCEDNNNHGHDHKRSRSPEGHRNKGSTHSGGNKVHYSN